MTTPNAEGRTNKKSSKHGKQTTRSPLPAKAGFDIADQDVKRRIGHFGGTGEPHMQKRGRADR